MPQWTGLRDAAAMLGRTHPFAAAILAILASIGLSRVYRYLRPLWPMIRRVPWDALRAARHLASSAWAWSRLPVRIQVVWIALLAGLAGGWSAPLWPPIPLPRPSFGGLDPLVADLRLLGAQHPVAAPVLGGLALLGLLHTAWVVGRSDAVRAVGRGLRSFYRFFDRLARRVLNLAVTVPLVLLLALLAAGISGLPTLSRVAPGGTLAVLGLVALRVAYTAATAARGRRPTWDGTVRVDDVSRLNEVAVERVISVVDAADVQRVVREARTAGKTVSIRGKSHTMGGQTLARGGWLVDTRFLRRIHWDAETGLVWVEAGATWGDVIRALNPHARAPMTMQSYCSFSVGGTLSANAHGITNDLAMVASVVRLEIVDANGDLVGCDRTENAELFRHVLGGYGLFGVLVRVALRSVPNTRLAMETASVRPAAFPAIYEPILADPTVEVKLARVDVTTFDQVFLYVFRKAAPQPTVSDLGASAREMSTASRLIYKWALPLRAFRQLRYAIEEVLQRPLDWSGEADRNVLMYESAAPLARMYAPLVELDETFVLQEFFVPPEAFVRWMDLARPILRRPKGPISLLNVTIRFVRRDHETALPYAQRDVYAFVLYFRLPRSPAGDAALAAVHDALAEGTLALGGTFYLPYRHHYSVAQMARAYPMAPAFFAAKRRLDPHGRFTNEWYRAYAPAFGPIDVPATDAAVADDPVEVDVAAVEVRRTHSYTSTLASAELRDRFARYLDHVFPIEDPGRIQAAVAQEVAAGRDDLGVYRGLLRRQRDRPLARWFALRNRFRQVRELRTQKAELLREVRAVLALAGRRGPIRGLASFGDPGRLVLGLRKMGVQGPVFVVHDRARALDPLERGSLLAVGETAAIDYVRVDEIDVPTGSVDLVTCMMGLHHFPPDRLPALLAIVRRILRPGGLFLFREHDARPDLLPTLDLAHSVFNAVTGVPEAEEATEIRAFRPIREWRAILRQAGFDDTGALEADDLDSTEDLMLCFRAPEVHVEAVEPARRVEEARADLARRGVALQEVEPEFTFFRLTEWLLVDMAQVFALSMDTVQWYRFPFMRFAGLYWRTVDAEVRAASRVRGPGRAFASSGALMAAVIGVIATLQFAAMKLMAVPLLWIFGADVPDELEQLLVVAPPDVDFGALDPGIRVTPTAAGLTLLEVPRHRPFTRIILALCELGTVELLEASGHRGALQVRASTADLARIPAIRAVPGVEVVTVYRFPVGDGRTQVALAVPIGRLFASIRALRALGDVRVEQVYDLK